MKTRHLAELFFVDGWRDFKACFIAAGAGGSPDQSNVRIGLVERVGRRVGIIYAGQLRNGRIPPDYSTSTVAGVTVILPGGPADLKFVELLVTEENRRQRTFSVSEPLILAHFWRERQVNTQSITKLIQHGEAEARAITENLVESGLIEARDSGKGRSYILSASVYCELGQSVSYVHATRTRRHIY